MIGEKLGPYEIREEIGRGGMGIVYRAYHPSLDREIAIKVLPPHLIHNRELVQRFLREARAVAKLNHPNIVTVHDVGEHEGTYYFAMQLVDGIGLDQAIAEKGAFSLEETKSIVKQVAGALGYAHQRDIIHRDVKPGNIIIDSTGQAVLTDFGIAKAITDTRLTQTGTSLGSPEYMSPEQAKGKPADHRSDLYSLGVVFYKLLTGCAPYSGETPLGLAVQHISEPVPAIRDVMPALPGYIDTIIQKLMAKEPSNRYQSASDLIRSLAMEGSVEEGVQSEAPPSLQDWEATTPAERTDRKKRVYIIGAVICVAAIALIAVFYIDKYEPSSRAHHTGVSPPIPSQPDKAEESEAEQGDQSPPEIRPGQIWMEPMTGIELVWIPPGEFLMGSNSSEAFENETPVHKVALDGFWMGRYEVTQGQWKKIVSNNPSFKKLGDNYPVDFVNWNDAQEFIRRLNEHTGQTFRLPSEAEWEYACRAGTTGDRHGNLDDIAWYRDNSGGGPHPVGEKQPNDWGLYDMLGNITEWCQDLYGEYSSVFSRNPRGALSGSFRVVRGGGWYYNPRVARASFRFNDNPLTRIAYLGFRLAKDK